PTSRYGDYLKRPHLETSRSFLANSLARSAMKTLGAGCHAHSPGWACRIREGLPHVQHAHPGLLILYRIFCLPEKSVFTKLSSLFRVSIWALYGISKHKSEKAR